MPQLTRVLGPSGRNRLPLAVAVVAVFAPGDQMLWGKRRDDGLLTTAAGHLNPGEDPAAGAVRELWEEAGIRAAPEQLQPLGSRQAGQYRVHCFRLDLPEAVEATNVNDPDEELEGWEWIANEDGRPPSFILENLHVPLERNVLLGLLFGLGEHGIQKAELILGAHCYGDDQAVLEVHPSGAGFRVAWSDAQGALGYTGLLSKAEAAEALASWTDSLHARPQPLAKAEEQRGRDIVVCIPKARLAQVEAEEKQVAAQVAAGHKPSTYFWTVHRLPRELPRRVYFAWDGAVRAYHDCVGSVQKPDPRLLMDHVIHNIKPIEMPAFRGWRYFGASMLGKAEAERCDRCSREATARVLYAEGHSYVPACDRHKESIAAPLRQKDDFSGFKEVAKSESDVDQMLRHPNPVERSMALKMKGVRRHHLAQALASGDPALEAAALAHPGLDEGIIDAVAGSSGRWAMKRKLLARRDLCPAHIEDMTRSALGALSSTEAAGPAGG